MRRSNRAIAAATVVLGLALGQPSGWAGMHAVEPVVEPAGPVAALPQDGEPRFTFTLNSDELLTPPLARYATDDSPYPLPSASPAVPLPAAVWSGFAGLAALGAVSLSKRFRRAFAR